MGLGYRASEMDRFKNMRCKIGVLVECKMFELQAVIQEMTGVDVFSNLSMSFESATEEVRTENGR